MWRVPLQRDPGDKTMAFLHLGTMLSLLSGLIKVTPDIFSSFPPYCQQFDRKIKPLFMMTSATSSSSLWRNLLSQGPYVEQLLWLEVWNCDGNPGLGQIISPLPCSPPCVGGVPLNQGHLEEGLHHIGQLVYYCFTKGNGLWVAKKKKR